MKNGMVLLSSRERKALFRAVQAMDSHEFYIPEHRYQTFLDDLDDGGIWNPCFLILPDNDDSMIGLLFAMAHGGNIFPEFEHDLEMIKDRALYVSKRRDEAKSAVHVGRSPRRKGITGRTGRKLEKRRSSGMVRCVFNVGSGVKNIGNSLTTIYMFTIWFQYPIATPTQRRIGWTTSKRSVSIATSKRSMVLPPRTRGKTPQDATAAFTVSKFQRAPHASGDTYSPVVIFILGRVLPGFPTVPIRTRT